MANKYKFFIFFIFFISFYPMTSKTPIQMPPSFWMFQCKFDFAQTRLAARYFSEKGFINNLFYRSWDYSYSGFSSI
jgi:hypothetical protein